MQNFGCYRNDLSGIILPLSIRPYPLYIEMGQVHDGLRG
jgi:hypothetical protein